MLGGAQAVILGDTATECPPWRCACFDHVPLAYIYSRVFRLDFSAKLECFIEVLNYCLPVHESVVLHGR